MYIAPNLQGAIASENQVSLRIVTQWTLIKLAPFLETI